MGPNAYGTLGAVVAILAAAAGAYVGTKLHYGAPPWGLAVGLTVLSGLPGCLVVGFWRRRGALWLLSWFLATAFCFTAVVPVVAAVASSIASTAGGRQVALLVGTALCWGIQILPAILLAQKGRTGRRLGVAFVLLCLRLGPILVGAVAVAIVAIEWSRRPVWLLAAVAVTISVVMGAATNALYLLWVRRSRQSVPAPLREAVARARQLTGVGFDECVVLPADWHEQVCEVRVSPLRQSVLVVTRGVVDRLSERELLALVAHELKHVIAGDVTAAKRRSAILSVALLIPFVYGAAWIGSVPTTRAALLGAGVMIVSMVRLSIELFYIRRRERLADDFAAGLVDVDSLRGALTKISEAAPPQVTSIWSTHDSVHDRLTRLDRSSAVPEAK